MAKSRLFPVSALAFLLAVRCGSPEASSTNTGPLEAKPLPKREETPLPEVSEPAEPVPTVDLRPKQPAPDDPMPDPITHPCVVHAAQFDVTLEKGDSSCTSDGDCACFPGGISHKTGCGGITSVSVANELHRIAKEFHIDGCPKTINCAARRCEPKCVQGKCA